MKVETDEAEVISRLIRTIGADQLIRAIFLTSSRANPGGPLDLLSDYDIELVVSDPVPFATSNDWLEAFGKPLLRVRDTASALGVAGYICMVLYADGTKIDYTIWPLALFDAIREEGTLPDNLDLGYRVILDKDGRARDLPAPTYTAHIPAKPTEQEFTSTVEEFWWVATYVAKYLWRDELVPVKTILDYEMKFLPLRKMLEWRIEIDQGWSLKPGFFGRGLRKYLGAATWAQFEETYVGPGREENWRALFETIELFRRVAVEVANALGYRYPHDVDAQMMDYLHQIQALDQG